jgi:hypothetical protein
MPTLPDKTSPDQLMARLGAELFGEIRDRLIRDGELSSTLFAIAPHSPAYPMGQHWHVEWRKR